jgi:tetratricopeptide (TPR) repeat protein
LTDTIATEQVIEEARKLPADTIPLDQLQRSAEDAVRSRDAGHAWATALHVLNFYPRSVWAYRMLAQVLALQGRADEALRQYVLVVSAEPLDAEAYRTMVILASALDRKEDARRYRILAEDHHVGCSGDLSPMPAELSPTRMAILQERSGLTAQAIDSLRKAVASDSSRIDLYLLLARSLYRLRAFVDAQAVVNTILSASPDCLEANILAASLSARAGRGDDATAYRDLALGLDPTGRRLAQLAPALDMPPGLIRKAPEVSFPPRQYVPAPQYAPQAHVGDAEKPMPVFSHAVEQNSPTDEPVAAVQDEDSHPVSEAPVTEETETAEPETATATWDHDAAVVRTDLESRPAAVPIGAAAEKPEARRDSAEITETSAPQVSPAAGGTPHEPFLTEHGIETEPRPPDEVDKLEEEALDQALVEEPSPAVEPPTTEPHALEEAVTAPPGASEGSPTTPAEPMAAEPFPDFEAWFQENVLDIVESEMGPGPPSEETSGRLAQSSEPRVPSSEFGAQSSEPASLDAAPKPAGAAGEVEDGHDATSPTQDVEAQGPASVVESAEAASPAQPQPLGAADLVLEQRDVSIVQPEGALISADTRSAASSLERHEVGVGPSPPDSLEKLDGIHPRSGTVPAELDAESTAQAPAREETFREAAESEPSVEHRTVRRWSVPSFERRRREEPIRSKLADLAETVEREPLNNGSRFDLARELEGADPAQAVAQYAIIVRSRDPRLVSDVRDRLELLIAGGVKVHGLQRLAGDVCMQQGAFERAIEAYSLAFDELRSRQITDLEKRR